MLSDEQIIRATAEKVMGWERGQTGSTNFEPDFAWFSEGKRVFAEIPPYLPEGMPASALTPYWNPLVSDRDAWAVVDKLLSMIGDNAPGAYPFNLCGDSAEVSMWVANFCGHKLNGRGRHKDRTRAICIAALKAVGAWEDGDNAQ